MEQMSIDFNTKENRRTRYDMVEMEIGLYWFVYFVQPVTDEQVFYDKFLCDKFYLPSARVYMQQI